MKAFNEKVILRNLAVDPSGGGKNLIAAINTPVTVYETGTTNLASLFDLDENPISNPTSTDIKGNVAFKVADGVYDIVGGTGENETRWDEVSIFDQVNLKNGVIVFQTYAELDAYTPQSTDEERTSYKVTNDPSTSLNGYYSWVSGTTYQKDADLVVNVIDESNTSDAVSGKAVVDYNVPLFGTSFPGASEYWETLSTREAPEVMLLDEDDRILFSDYGVIDAVYGGWYLRELKQRTRADKSGTPTQLRVLNIGDSWTHLSARYTQQLGKDLVEYMGDGLHAGFTGFSWGFGDLPTPSGLNTNYNPDETSVSLTGAWTANYATETSPDICSAQSSTAGDYIELTTTTYGKVGTLYAKNNGAEIRYQSDGGAWTNLTLSGSDEFFNLTLPDQVGVTIKFEVVSGTAILYGAELRNLSGGAIINKVGATGSTLNAWAEQSNNEQWRKNIQNLAPNTVTILHGTNDQGNFTKDEFKANGKMLIDNIRSVLPLADIVLIAPCENGRGFQPSMTAYQAAFFELAKENKCCFINLQSYFGEGYSEYGNLSNRKWFEDDLIHPVPATGGYAIVDAIFKTFTG